MSRKELPLSHETIAPFDLEAFVNQATALNQRNAETITTPFPKAPHRWLSHYQFIPRPIAFTAEGEVEGDLSGLLGAVIDFSFTRSLCAPSYSAQGGHCYDPASLCFLEVAVKVDSYPDYASFCSDLHQQDKGRSYRELAGLHQAIPGEDDLSYFRRRVGAQVMEAILANFVDFFRAWGLICGERLATDGQLEPAYARFKGCAHFCQACQQFPLEESGRQELCRQLHSGATRLQLLCPFPEVVQKVQQATTKAGKPHEPKVTLLEVAYVPADSAQAAERQQVAALLGLPVEEVPSLRIRRRHLTSGPQGERWGHCPQVPSDLEARVGYHVDTKDPSKKERVFGYLHQRTTDINVKLGLKLPVGHSTYPANANEGTHFPEHRATVALPVLPHQVQLGDAGYDHIENYQWIRSHGGIPIIAYNPRNENLAPEALLKRGYDQHGTPSAPCGRLCRSNGYDYQAESRQYVCGRPCPLDEQDQCPHATKPWGYSHRMAFSAHPRLSGPMQRGTPPWHRLYAARIASERINSYDQEVIDNGRPPKLRGLQAFRFSGAIRTLAQLLRRACAFVLNVTYTLSKLHTVQT
jgi:hypothetical protein